MEPLTLTGEGFFMPFKGPRRGAHGIFIIKGYNVGVYTFIMWEKLKNLFRKKAVKKEIDVKRLKKEKRPKS